MVFDSTQHAFRHGLNPSGLELPTSEPSTNQQLFMRINHWPPSDLVDDRDSANRVGRAFRASAFYLDQLSVPVAIGRELLEDSIARMGKIHMKMHGGRHPFGPSHVATAVANAFAGTGPYPAFLVKAGKSSDELEAAIMEYARRDNTDLMPL